MEALIDAAQRPIKGSFVIPCPVSGIPNHIQCLEHIEHWLALLGQFALGWRLRLIAHGFARMHAPRSSIRASWEWSLGGAREGRRAHGASRGARLSIILVHAVHKFLHKYMFLIQNYVLTV